VLPHAAAGTLYRYKLEGNEQLLPDPASRFQPEGPHGPSQVIDPDAFEWSDENWRGVSLPGQVIYEMHIGSFTHEGTWAAAAHELHALAATGVTVLEIMPVAEFPGRFGWGYDGVDLFAPTQLYGVPDDFRSFVDQAHAVGLGVILDVVYNHLGPEGNYLKSFAPEYFSSRHNTDWGEAINFDEKNNGPVREFFIANAGYWITEFHLDGLRIDATQNIYDDSTPHILAEIVTRVQVAAGGRATIIIGENEPQNAKLLQRQEQGGYGLDGLWNDDFHHSATVALTGRNEAYYTDYQGKPQEFISAYKHGFLFQGQRYKWQKQRRGTPVLGVQPAQFITFLQNHDQIANSGHGLRAHQMSSPALYRAMTALLLLGPGTPMLFQGQEFAASSPFYYFADNQGELAKLTAEGRAKFLSQFRTLAVPEVQAALPDPADPETIVRSKLDLMERERHDKMYALHCDLLHLRRADPVLRLQRRGELDGAVLSEGAFVLRYFSAEHGDRLLVVNLGSDLHLDPAPEPLLAPPAGQLWEIKWSSEDLRYGGYGRTPCDTEENWRIAGRAAVFLIPSDVERSHG
jgi:maltooligosyltrehalose trehalohydrolase